jgi:phytoene dehydrogenase-like protein
MTDEADAIVVGSGINGLVCAAELARAGWSVILLERNAEIGGFIASEERTLPGYLHDTFSSWHPLFVSGPAYAALGELLHRHGLGWTEALAEGYANRVLDRVARHAPDLRDKIRAVDVLTPDDLCNRNPNAVCGDPYGGSAELDQSLLWRPLASSGRHATPVGRLWHIGASTHPGAGLGGASGHLVATTLTKRKA